MQFSDSTNKLGIVEMVDFLCDSDSTSYPIAQKTREINSGYEDLIGQIISADGTWQWDDTNHTNLPRATGTLVEGQQNYNITTTFLEVTMVEILSKTSTDGYYKIKPLDHTELGDLSPEQYFGTESDGSPKKGEVLYYDKTSQVFRLYYSPTADNNTLAKGIRIWYKRTADLFAATDTTQVPGLPSTYHSILAYMAAISYCMKYKPERIGLYQRKVDEMRKNLMSFYNKREKDKRKVMTGKKISYI